MLRETDSMFELIREHQLNLMLMLCGGCAILILLLANTRFMSRSRKAILVFMEVMAFFLLWFDRAAYIYAGGTGSTAYTMVRVSNFIVFFLTPGLVLGLNLYVADWLTHEGKLKRVPILLRITAILSVAGMVLAVIAAFTDLYYYFDETNKYHRGSGFLIAYIIPVLCPILQFVVVRKNKKVFSRLIYISILLYIFVPIICGITQIFAYGISIVNMSMVAVSVSMYIFLYLDINNTVEHAHRIEIESMQGEHERMRRLFDQTANAFVSAVEKKDDLMKGNSSRVAKYAKLVAEHAGKSPEDCEKVYYAALLHDVGLIGIPDEEIINETDPVKGITDIMRRKPLIGEEILSSITEYPYLVQGAHYSHEKYDGTGYPEGLKGEEIPEIARIIAVADDYVSMITRKRYRGQLPQFVAREAFVKYSGERYDPFFADIMVKIIDADVNDTPSEKIPPVENELSCKEYREHITRGIAVESDVIRISFDCEPTIENEGFSAPSVVLFDSYDGRTHSHEKSIESYHYLEYGEVWFDKHSVATAARNIEEKQIDDTEKGPDAGTRYEITAGRCEDHLKLVMKSADYAKEVIVALPSRSMAVYIGLTGENCRLSNIAVETTGDSVGPEDIPRIAEILSYIDHLESDVKNVQIDRWMSAATESIEIKGRVKIEFNTMSLPSADLIWHCPYIVLFYSEDGRIKGPDYREYNIIKLNGEDQGDKEFAKNRFTMEKKDSFPGWDKWKEINKKGLECEVDIERKGDRIVLRTENLGISIENTTTVLDDRNKVYVAISGDQVALTDIRIYSHD